VEYNTINIKKVFHVGTLDIDRKRKKSYEGSGLSVSNLPNAWIKINPELKGEIIKLEKQDNKFLEFYSLNNGYKDELAEWGVEHGYITTKYVYVINTFENNKRKQLVFEDVEEAEEKSNELGLKYITYIESYATDKLKKESMQETIYKQMTLDILLTVYIETTTDLDGIWWNEVLDIKQLSAPRGVIFNSKLDTWDIMNK
jgi:hypothetical protein